MFLVVDPEPDADVAVGMGSVTDLTNHYVADLHAGDRKHSQRFVVVLGNRPIAEQDILFLRGDVTAVGILRIPQVLQLMGIGGAPSSGKLVQSLFDSCLVIARHVFSRSCQTH